MPDGSGAGSADIGNLVGPEVFHRANVSKHLQCQTTLKSSGTSEKPADFSLI